MNTLHRQMDWRTLTVEPHRQQRRHHNRNIFGPLQPMDREDKWPTWTKIVVIGGAILAAYVTLNGGRF